MNHITLEKAVELARTVKMSEWVGSQVQAVCNAAIEWHIAQQKQFLNAEEYLRYKYGAYRGFPAWREIEEGYNQGRYDEAMAQGPDAEPKVEPSKFLLNGMRFKMAFDGEGTVICFRNFGRELHGKWVALVAAENDCHLQPAPKAEPVNQKPLTDAQITVLVESYYANDDSPVELIRHVEKLHGIGGQHG